MPFNIVKTFKSLDRNTYNHMAAYENLLESIGIKGFSLYLALKYRDLTGPTKLIMF